jgi:hypothetical protein
MLQAPAIVVGVILIFVLASGLLVLWRRGIDDLEAWGRFVSRILRGDTQPSERPLHGSGDEPIPRPPAVEGADGSESPTR